MKKVRLNIIDFIIIAIVFVLALSAFYVIKEYIRLNENGLIEQKVLERYLERANRVSSESKREASIMAYCSIKNLRKEELKEFFVGLQEASESGVVFAEIVDMRPPGPNYFDVHMGRAYAEGDLYSLPVKLKLRGICVEGTFWYKAENIYENRHFIFIDKMAVFEPGLEDPLFYYTDK